MLNNIQSLILDMDGVLWRDDTPIGDLPNIFDRIRTRGMKFVFATNNATKTPEQYLEKLSKLGVAAERWQVITSALGTADMLSRKIPTGGKVFVVGEEGLKQALRDKGFQIAEINAAEGSVAVVAGFDHYVSFAKMSEAALLVRRGVPFFGTNPDKTFPTPRGEIPGAGAWISVIVTATNVEPTYVGKPFPFMMEMALEHLGTKKENTLVVGDRLETDIAAGQAVGCPTALVLSGVSTRAQAEAWRPAPSLIVQDLEALIA